MRYNEPSLEFYKNASPEEREDFKSWLKGLLHDGAVMITFTKVDGSVRVMTCSLKKELLPPPPEVKEGEVKKERKVNPEVCPVFDLEKQDWRSIKYETIKKIEFSIGG